MHNAASSLATVGSAALILSQTNLPTVDAGMALASAGLFSLFVGPDLDVDSGNISHKLARETGKIPLVLWTIFWEPYGYAIKHRSKISHMPILGTLLRLIYLVTPLSINVLVEDDRIRRAIALSSGLSQILAIVPIVVIFALVQALIYARIDLAIFFALFIGQVMFNDFLHFIFDGGLRGRIK